MKRPSREAVLGAVKAAGGNMKAAAVALGCSRGSLYTWVYQLGLADAVGVELAPPRRVPVAGDPRAQRAVSIRESTWRWARHHAIDRGCTAAEVVEDALELLRAVECQQ